jgi:small subunit ribosomal protein S5
MLEGTEEEAIKEEEKSLSKIPAKTFDKESWKPKTGIGKKVKESIITDIDNILDEGLKILEPEIVDTLIPNLEKDLLLIGQSKGKFGGGQRRVFKQTQKKTREGNKPNFASFAIVGDKNGHIGLGYGKSKETVPGREKSIRNAKLNVIKIRRGCGSWQCGCKEPHTIPFTVSGKCGSVTIRLMPAPKGTGLCVERECQKILRLAGIKDVWSETFGHTKTKINLVKACLKALHQLIETKIQEKYKAELGLVEGKVYVEEKTADIEVSNVGAEEHESGEAENERKNSSD